MNGFRLSPQQRRLWRLRQTRGDGVLAARLLAIREGDLDSGALRRAAEHAVRRHEVLRTTFSCPAGVSVPLQHVGKAGPVWEEVDLSGLSGPEQRARLEEPAALPNLETGPAVRFLLARLAPGRHALRIDLPALCAGAASLENLLAEIAGEVPEGDVFQYADLAEWQAGFLEGEETESGREVWRRRGLADLPPLRLPFARRDPEPFLPGRLPVPLDAPLPPDVLLAGWQCLLRRFTGQAEVTLGAGMAGRGYDGLAGAIGPLARYVPITARIEAGEPFRDVAGRAARALAEAGEWQEFFDWEALLGPPGEAGPPVLAAGFDVRQRRAIPGFAIESVEVSPEPFTVCLSGDSVRLQLVYDRSAVYEDDARTLARSLAALLEAAVADPDLPVDALPLLDEAERARIVAAAGGPGLEQAPGCIHRRIEEQARLHPGRPAVVFEDREMTYGELDARASRLAARLRRQGAGPDAVVALRLERGIEMIVAILGVWKAGAAYLPVDPSLPAERQELLVRDSGAMAVVEDVDGMDPDGFTGPEPAPENLAYVLYTSGSTGRPKGVMVEHRQLWSYVHAVAAVLDLPPGSSYATVSTFAADLGNTAVFPALATGGTLHVLSQERIGDARAMADYFERHTIDCLKIVPSHLEALQASARGDRLLPRRRLVVGGEACRWEWVDAVHAAAPGCRVLNHYGPTETTVGVATCDLGGAGEHRSRTARPPLGRPLAGCRLDVLDARLEPVPDWMPGEIHAGGAQVARGYLGRPAATAERFLPDPLGPPGGRLYRTGDLARRLPDGNLEFLGRADDQVKVRGFRVEPGEIAAVLETHPGVRRAEVLARPASETGGGQPRLVAYLIGSVPADELRAFLAARLPDFMVPAAFVPLEALPLTANGKVDRRRLPEPDWDRLGPKAYAAPRDAVEEALAEVWGAVLGKDRPGIDDDFFTLGGDSILSIVVSARAEERGLAFPVQQLFETPTIRRLAAALRSRTSSPASRPSAGPFELIAAADRARLPAEVEDAYPLAQLQAGMLFHSQLNPESAVYHDLHSFHLRAPFDPGAMDAALRRAVARHPALRTAFDLSGEGEPLQLVFREAEPPLAVEDLRGLPEAERRERIDEWLAAERGRPFAAAAPPLVRFAIHRRTDETFQFTLSFHHAVLDGWSRASLLTELFHLYLALAAGEDPAAPPPLAVGYRDFVALERETLRSEAARDYWRRSLADATATPLPRWPASPAPPGVGSHIVVFPPAVSDRLHAVAREAGVPVKSVLLAGHLAVLSRLAGRDDVVSGLVTHGRPEQTDGERVLGLFLNNLPFRVRLADGSWRELVRRVFEQEREMLPFRRQPLAGLQRETGPLFEAVFNFLHYHVYHGLSGLPGVEVLEQSNYEETNFPLLAHFYLVPATGRVELLLNLRRPGLGAAQGEAIAGLYRRALTALAADPEGRHEAAVLLSAAERHQVLVEWNDTPGEAAPVPVHRLFREQARRTPDRVAVRAAGREATYAGLETLAGRIAGCLRSLGAGPETRVALCLEPSVESVAGLLGILEAGAAYVPLDPAHPRERLALLLEDSAAPLLLSRRSLAAGLGRARLVDVDELDGTAEGPEASPENLAYVIYTSGSTGRPKGVQVTHRSLANFLRAMRRSPGLDETERLLAVTTLSFDIAALELLLPLTAGATAVLADREETADGERLAARLAAEGVTVMQATPATWRLLLESGWPGDPRLRALCGGEALPRPLADRLLERTAELWNVYGPTETTVWSTVWRVEPDGPVSAGRPIDATQVWLLDAHGRPVLAGVPAELLLGGAGLARGYLGRPDLTAERFVPDPFGESGRLYRTGDLARRLPDGRLELLGRLDHQVKVRGHRIEPGEIEAALAAHPAVAEAAVLLREDRPGDARLVAWIVPAAGADPDPDGLRAFLRQRLPEVMVPAVFRLRSDLPRTPNGKLDRRSLAVLPEAAGEGEAPRAAPRTPVEEMLAGIWAEVLATDRSIGAHDSFFDLGGHSLLATRVASRVRQAFGVELPLRTLFDAPTLAAFAARVEAARRQGGRAEAPPLVPVPRASEPPLSFAQQRLWFLQQLDPESPAYNVPAAVRLTGPLDPAALGAALEEVVRRHEALRTHFEPRSGGPVQVIDAAMPLPLPWIDLSALAAETREAEARRLAVAAARRPFDLGRKPLIRTALLRLGGAEHALLLTLHHTVGDGWSMGVLLREAIVLYRAFSAGAPPLPSPLPPLPVQYADFAVWQRGWLQGAALDEQLGYWRGRLAGAPAALRLPTDRPRPPGPPGASASRTVELPAELTRSLRALGRREGATLFMVLFAAWTAVLRHFTGQQDLVLGTNVANRNRAETEGLIGFFVNLLPLRAGLDGDPDVRELLARVREATLGAYAHQDVPFETLVQELGIERAPGLPPLVQAVIDFQTASPGLPELPGVALSELAEAGEAAAKFDLVLIAIDAGDQDGSERGLSCTLRYRTDLFYASTAAGLLEGLELCLDLAARRPETRLGALLDALDERARLRDQEAREAVERRRQGKSWRTRPQPMAIQEMEGGS